MKFTLPRELLLLALNRIQGLADRKMVGKGSGCLKMSCLQSNLQILATDGDIYMLQDLPDVQVKAEGEAIVATKVLHDIVRYADAGSKLTVELLEKVLRVSYGSANFKLNLVAEGSVPAMPELASSHAIDIESSLLARIFKQVNFAASKDKLCRPFLCGVNLTFDNDKLVALATDGFRLARKKVDAKSPESPGGIAVPSVIIPSKAVAEAQKILDESEVSVKVAFDRQVLRFDFPNVKLCVRLVDANFPDCDPIFPKEDTRTDLLCVDDVSKLINVVERISAVSLEKREPLKIILSDDGQMTISTFDRATGSAEEKISVDYQGEPLTLGLNSRYLLEILHCMLSNKAMIWPGKANEPVLIKDKLDRQLEYLLMPMQT